jgi:hypothetical protein
MGGFRHAFFFNAPAAAINLCGIKPRPSEGLPDVQGPAGLNCASIRALRNIYKGQDDAAWSW